MGMVCVVSLDGLVPTACSEFPNIASQTIAQRGMEAVLAHAYPAMVRLDVIIEEPEEGRLQKFPVVGSGIIIRKDGYVLTNHHVAGRAKRIRCRLSTGEELEADWLGSDPLTDIAVLKLRRDPSREAYPRLSTAVFGDSDAVRAGDTVYAVGCPAGLAPSVTCGIVSNPSFIFSDLLFWPFPFELDGEEVGTLVRWIGHDAPIYPGSSGGPLVNERGKSSALDRTGRRYSGESGPSRGRPIDRTRVRASELDRHRTASTH